MSVLRRSLARPVSIATRAFLGGGTFLSNNTSVLPACLRSFQSASHESHPQANRSIHLSRASRVWQRVADCNGSVSELGIGPKYTWQYALARKQGRNHQDMFHGTLSPPSCHFRTQRCSMKAPVRAPADDTITSPTTPTASAPTKSAPSQSQPHFATYYFVAIFLLTSSWPCSIFRL